MKTAEDVESYLLKMGAPYEQVKPGIWLIKLDGTENLAVSIGGPVVAFRMKVMDAPRTNREKLFETLLQLNTTDMLYGAFALEKDKDAIVIVATMQLENLDYNEFSAVVDEFALAVAKHYPNLSKFRTAA